MRLHAVALGHPVAGDRIYSAASRAFAGHPEVNLEPEQRKRLLELHRQLLSHSGSEGEDQPPEPLMLLPWLVREEWRQLNTCEVRGAPSISEAEIPVWRKYLDELSPLLALPSLECEGGPPGGDSTSFKCAPKANSPSTLHAYSSVCEEACECWKKAGTRTGLNLWRKFQ